MKGRLIKILLLIMAIALALVVFLIIRQPSTESETESPSKEDEEASEKWQEGVISYNGKEYVFNNKLKTYLFMGIDKDGEVAEGVDAHDGGQSDAMFLLVADEENESVKIVSIPRNTMAMVDEYTEDNEFCQRREMQICLAHAYGDGKRQSCNRAAEATSRLFYQLPINGYFSVNMGAVPIINSMVDGVTLTSLEDVISEGTVISEGSEVTLTDQQAYDYVHYRRDEFGAANDRLDRQTQYINAYLAKLLAISENEGKAALLERYAELEPYVVTNLDFADFIDRVSGFTYDENDIVILPGHLEEGEFDEYYPDNESFYEMILDIWYSEQTESNLNRN